MLVFELVELVKFRFYYSSTNVENDKVQIN